MSAGMKISAFNDIPIREAIKPFLAQSVTTEDNQMKLYALRVLLAGNHVQERKISVKINGKNLDYFPDQSHLSS
ncbi:MAG: hypothetical protein H7199_02050 [Burkholderiales bacterium]|nr:hypothetical protein [Flavobacterium sp.]